MAKALKQYGDCEGPLGIPMSTDVAREVEAAMKDLPSELKDLGLQHVTKVPSKFEMVPGERADVSLITTDSIDRDGEVISPSGLDFSQFMKSPVVTYCHRYDALPVGRAMWVKESKRPAGYLAKTRYTTKPDSWSGDWFPDAVLHMVSEGDLNGKSIGFIGVKGHYPTPDEIKKNPALAECRYIFDKAIVLEYAVCAVQANQDALVIACVKAKKAGVAIPSIILEAAGFLLPDEVEPLEQKHFEEVAAKYQMTHEEVVKLALQEFQLKLNAIDPNAMVAEIIDLKRGRV